LRRGVLALSILVAATAILGITATSAVAADPVIAAAGDIACDPADGGYNGGAGTPTRCRQQYTSDLLVGAPLSAVLTLGDSQYEDGLLTAFNSVYDPSWGRVKTITRPVPGNHEYQSSAAAGYFDYFNGVGNANGQAGDRTKGYYSFNVGLWHLIALNSNCARVGGCGAGSPQEQWLRTDLANSGAHCTLAYWHHPLFSSGNYSPGLTQTRPLFQALYDYNADVVLSGHDHNYERFAPQAPDGTVDLNRGIRQFIVGSGGAEHYSQGPAIANSQVRNSNTFGVLKLTLHPISYEWTFQPEAGGTFYDTGSDFCDFPSGRAYARPRSATPIDVEFVPASVQCTSANGTHGAPLALPSCNPARPVSTQLTIGTPDSNGKGVNFKGHLKLKVLGESPIDTSNGDQADVSIVATFSDIRRAGTLADYTGQLQGQLVLRVTDRSNGTALDDSATVTDTPLSFTIPCQSTADANIGSTCNLTSTADAISPGIAKEGKRAVWEVLRAQILDGGPDGLASTADNSLFAVQGVFAP
jgi:acid phosphatase type 7